MIASRMNFIERGHKTRSGRKCGPAFSRYIRTSRTIKKRAKAEGGRFLFKPVGSDFRGYLSSFFFAKTFFIITRNTGLLDTINNTRRHIFFFFSENISTSPSILLFKQCLVRKATKKRKHISWRLLFCLKIAAQSATNQQSMSCFLSLFFLPEINTEYSTASISSSSIF